MRAKSNVRRFAVIAMIAMVTVVAVACVSGPKIVKLYEGRLDSQSGYSRPFVIAVTGNAGQRVSLESQILARLHERGVTGIASHTLFDDSEVLLQEDIDRAVANTGADSLLISHIAGVETELQKVAGREEIVSTCRGGNPVDLFLYDHRVIKVPDSLRLAVSVVIISNLYDGNTGSRIWTIQSTCFRKDNIYVALAESSAAIVRQLVFDRLIRKSPDQVASPAEKGRPRE